MAVAVVNQTQQEPAFITYLLNPEVTHDFYFIVRSQHSGESEKIGAVKKMLMAHSEILRSELEESQLAMKHEVPLEDLFSDTLRNLLRYVYGYDNITTLTFDDADNLLYAAEKYMITPLKNKLAIHLMSLLDCSNICSLINNPACFRHLELSSEITKILQFRTDKVFASPQFLEISSKALVRILEQETMNVDEIEVWRAALKWAKHKASSEDGPMLRTQLSKHVKLIRFCTLGLEDLAREVLPSHVLTSDEFCLVCMSVGHSQKLVELKDICNNLEQRNQTVRVVASFVNVGLWNLAIKESILEVETKDFGLELQSLVFKGKPLPTGLVHTYKVDTNIHISKMYSNTLAKKVEFSQEVTHGDKDSVPITINGQNVQLLPNCTYIIRVMFNEAVPTYQCYNEIVFINDHITVTYKNSRYDHTIDRKCHVGHISCLAYRLLIPKN